jgi:hypothetical protein
MSWRFEPAAIALTLALAARAAGTSTAGASRAARGGAS